MTRAAQDRTLVLLRHAKAEQQGWDDDHERQLSARGRRDVDRAGETWEYVPHTHKNEHREQDRRVYLGPRSKPY